MRRKTALGAVLGGALACAAPVIARAAGPLRLATVPVDAAALAYYAKDRGAFEAAGLDVSIQSVRNGAAIAAAVLAGSLDIGWADIISLAAAYKRGLPFTIVGAGGLYVRGTKMDQLLVTRDSPIKTAADLDGKTIGCNGLANLGQLAPELWADSNGGDAKTLKFVELAFPQLVPALREGKVDAINVAEPFVSAARPFARELGIPFDLIAPRWMLGAWFTTTTWAGAHRTELGTFRSIMAQTADWADANPEQSAIIFAKYSTIDLAVVKRMVRVPYATHAEAAWVQPVIDLAARYGTLATFPAQELLFRA